MDDRLQSKLRRLGVVKGTRHLRPAPPPAARVEHQPRQPDGSEAALQSLLPGGYLAETAVGACFVLDRVYPLTHCHGEDCLAELLALNPAAAAVFEQDPRFNELHFRDFLFLDTETTGLAGAGAIAFMVGVAFFEQDALVVRQYFLRDHDDEAAMLSLLQTLLAERAGLVTFNGRSFDLPLLDTRYLMNRLPSPLPDVPHLDLLPPARRLWRNRLGSCALSALEPTLLGVRRTHEDVPGWLIPSLYYDYLHSGDASQLLRVFYHNRMDVLSMATLAARVTRLFAAPRPDEHALDLYSLGKWQADLGLTAEAEENLRRAAQADLPLAQFHQVLHRLGQLLKQNGRLAEAVPVWQQIAATSFDSVEAHVELAKYYEWRARDLSRALEWTEQALALVKNWGRTAPAALAGHELQHRLARLQRKLENKP